jgi:hypothetical protein
MMLSDGPKLLAIAIVLATIVAMWMLRYETLFNGGMHRNRFTGAVCDIGTECWFK